MAAYCTVDEACRNLAVVGGDSSGCRTMMMGGSVRHREAWNAAAATDDFHRLVGGYDSADDHPDCCCHNRIDYSKTMTIVVGEVVPWR